jgi:hypothetical protein
MQNMNNTLKQPTLFRLRNINSTRLWLIVFGILDGSAGVVHGLYETLRGYTPTQGFYLENFGAFSMIPNYLITGIAVILVALSITLWTIGFIHKKNGPLVLLVLTILLFFVGDLPQFFFGLIAWGVSTCINSPLKWWKKVLSKSARDVLAKRWLIFFVTGYVLLASAIGIWLVLLPPGTNHNNVPTINYLCWSLLGVGLLFQLPTIITGFARDIVRRES